MRMDRTTPSNHRKPALNSHSSAPRPIPKKRLPRQSSPAIVSNRRRRRPPQHHDPGGRACSTGTRRRRMPTRTRDRSATGSTSGARARRAAVLSTSRPICLRLKARLRGEKRNKHNGRRGQLCWPREMPCHGLRAPWTNRVRGRQEC